MNSAQIAQAYTTVMTDGSLIKPYIIDSFTDPVTKEKVQIGKTQNLGRVYSPETAAHMRDLMRQVVTTGSARRFDSPMLKLLRKPERLNMLKMESTRKKIISSQVFRIPLQRSRGDCLYILCREIWSRC
ncbi:hypothetical protein MGH68_13225 [Erysipelothrix sp. D19-032]